MQDSALSPDRELGGIISSWLIKLTISLAVLGVIGFDAVSIAAAAIGVEDTAVAAARDAADAVDGSGDPATAYPAALRSAQELSPQYEVEPTDVGLLPDGSAQVTVRRTAATMVVSRVPWIAGWADRSATATAAPLR